MKTIKKHILFLIILCIVFSTASCTKKSQKPKTKSEDEPKPLPKVIEEIEKDTLKIMNQADMVPYFQRVIVEKKKIEEKEKMEKMQMEMAKKNKDEDKKDQASGEQEKEKPKPMTIEESILTDLLKQEKTASDKDQTKPPKDITETWKNINTTIIGIHNKWNVLEPQLTEENVPPDIISGFEETLDALTKYGIDKNYFSTINTANNLTSYFPKFMPYFKKEIPPTVYTLKYLTRNVVLNAAMNDYDSAQKSLNKIKEQGQSIKSDLIEKKAKPTADKFDASVINLQKSIDKKDLNLIRINASIVMKNIILMMDDLSKSMQ
ncbi:hypothetical protein FQB35_08430 [Crassaminicella thermophila]|uniref:Lipoprotein n=1 Tax=Crassaminicella thermophila TaxID=2599308 RepID=A0A5C0SDP9_CRATE|nr:hypothetical protein [Crassaminicella thermophila]QEK12401.1 hypothetical protein FQB35_08430 [Crassaminicella thermophila]